MALHTDPGQSHEVYPHSLKPSRHETPLRDRPSTKFRIKSELRGAVKMPPIISSQANTSIQLPKNIGYSLTKTPLRRAPLRGEAVLPHLEDNSQSSDSSARPTRLLTIETTSDPKNFVPVPNNDRANASPSLQGENPLNFLNPLTNKPNYTTSLANNSYTPKPFSSIKPKNLSTRRHFNSKLNELSADRKINASDNTSYSPERREAIANPENTFSFPLAISQLPPLEPTRCSTKKSGVIKAYAANTNQGLIRDYNEDRVAIILNIMKPVNTNYDGEWPMCSFFGVYDGHGGTECADFLRDNLHQFVIKDRNFPFNPIEALKNGFQEAERQFTELAQQQQYDINRSGSCAIVTLFIDDMCYIANVGDSRAVMSCEQGKKTLPLSRDHKPNEENERERIIANGGKIYQTQIPLKQNAANGTVFPKTILGPHRVFPGRLSVSRTFGDIEAKLVKYGGIPGVVIAEPEIASFRLGKDNDFVVLACDGIFDKLNNEDVVRCVWDATKIKCENIHKQSSVGVENILNESMIQKSLDNVTAVLVCLEGYERSFSNAESPLPREKVRMTPTPTRLTTDFFGEKNISKLQASPNNFQTPKKALEPELRKENNSKLLDGPQDSGIQHKHESMPSIQSTTWKVDQKGEFMQGGEERTTPALLKKKSLGSTIQKKVK